MPGDSKDSKPEEKAYKDKTAEEKEADANAEKKKAIKPLDEDDIALLKAYGSGPYALGIKSTEDDIAKLIKDINDLKGIKESDTGLAPPSTWDLTADKQLMSSEQPLQVARCTKIISPGTEQAKYLINVKQIAKYVVGLGDRVSPTDIEEGMRVGVDRQNKYQIQIPLPPKIDPSVTMMTVEEKPDITYGEVGGAKEQIEKIREVVEMPMLNPERFIALGIDPPKGVLLYGPPVGSSPQARPASAFLVYTRNAAHTNIFTRCNGRSCWIRPIPRTVCANSASLFFC
jgi:26S proteasome regulatory subunit T1